MLHCGCHQSPEALSSAEDSQHTEERPSDIGEPSLPAKKAVPAGPLPLPCLPSSHFSAVGGKATKIEGCPVRLREAQEEEEETDS